MSDPLTAPQRDFLSRLAGFGMRRAIDPYLVDSKGRARFKIIDRLSALGYIRQHLRARGNRRALWVNITSAGERALQTTPQAAPLHTPGG